MSLLLKKQENVNGSGEAEIVLEAVGVDKNLENLRVEIEYIHPIGTSLSLTVAVPQGVTNSYNSPTIVNGNISSKEFLNVSRLSSGSRITVPVGHSFNTANYTIGDTRYLGVGPETIQAKVTVKSGQTVVTEKNLSFTVDIAKQPETTLKAKQTSYGSVGDTITQGYRSTDGSTIVRGETLYTVDIAYPEGGKPKPNLAYKIVYDKENFNLIPTSSAVHHNGDVYIDAFNNISKSFTMDYKGNAENIPDTTIRLEPYLMPKDGDLGRLQPIAYPNGKVITLTHHNIWSPTPIAEGSIAVENSIKFIKDKVPSVAIDPYNSSTAPTNRISFTNYDGRSVVNLNQHINLSSRSVQSVEKIVIDIPKNQNGHKVTSLVSYNFDGVGGFENVTLYGVTAGGQKTEIPVLKKPETVDVQNYDKLEMVFKAPRRISRFIKTTAKLVYEDDYSENHYKTDYDPNLPDEENVEAIPKNNTYVSTITVNDGNPLYSNYAALKKGLSTIYIIDSDRTPEAYSKNVTITPRTSLNRLTKGNDPIPDDFFYVLSEKDVAVTVSSEKSIWELGDARPFNDRYNIQKTL